MLFAAASVRSELPNSPATCCSWTACSLNCTISPGDAFCNAVCTWVDASAEDNADELADAPVPENV